MGFYVTRFAEAIDTQEAESRALEALRADPKLVPPADYKRSRVSRVHFEEIAELPQDKVPTPQPGFVWYPRDGAST